MKNNDKILCVKYHIQIYKLINILKYEDIELEDSLNNEL